MATLPALNLPEFTVPDCDVDLNDGFYSAVTISLGELYEDGLFDPTDESWHWDAYNEEQYTRVCEKIVNRYYYRELGILPVGAWKRAYLRVMNEIMPKYKRLYALLDTDPDIMQTSDEYEKSRNIFSDFPATQLSGNSDYTSTGTDLERERVTQGDFAERYDAYARTFRDVDVMILDDIDFLFTSLITVNTNCL